MALGGFLSTQFSEIRVVCYLRRQDPHGSKSVQRESQGGLYYHRLKHGQSPCTTAEAIHHASLIERWSNAFGRDAIQIRVVEPERLVNANVVDDFVRNALDATLVLPVKIPPIPRSALSPSWR